jgi:flagellar biosynthesis/type III secretory pathway protein FliH
MEDAPMLEETALEWRKQYVKEGRKEGLKEGRQEGMRQLLLQQIERRFGPLPAEQRRRVEAITSPARLKRLADKILTVSSLDEMGL